MPVPMVDEQDPWGEDQVRAPLPRERDPSDDDQSHAQRDPPVDVFAEHEPGQQGRERALQVQEQRRRGCGRPLKADHKEHGTEHVLLWAGDAT